MYRGDEIVPGLPSLEVEVGLDSYGSVIVDITTVVDGEVLDTIKSSGGEILLVSVAYHSIRARVSIMQLEAIAGLAQVRFIQPKQEANSSSRNPPVKLPSLAQTTEKSLFATPASLINQQLFEALNSDKTLPNGTTSIGIAATEGDATHRASTARGTFNVDGTGVKIGVLSDGVTTITTAQASGDIGSVTVLPGQEGSGDKGTAVLEIIHDIAPGAELYFATSTTSITSFAQNIRDLRAAGCDIIVDDTSYFRSRRFRMAPPWWRQIPMAAWLPRRLTTLSLWARSIFCGGRLR